MSTIRSNLIPSLLAAVLPAMIVGCPKRTDPELAKEVRQQFQDWLAKSAKVPEAENGALLVMKGAQALKELPAAVSKDDFDPSKAEMAAALRTWLKENEEALRSVEKGLEAKAFAYTTDFEKGVQATVPPLKPMKTAGDAFVLRGRLARAEGKPGNALRDDLLALRLGASLTHRALLITWMISVAVSSSGLGALLDDLRDPACTADDLASALDALKAIHAGRGAFSAAMETEYYAFQLPALAEAAEGKGSIRSNFRADREVFRKCIEAYRGVDPAKYYAASENLRTGNLSGLCGLDNEKQASVAMIALPQSSKYFATSACLEAVWNGTIALCGVLLHKARNAKLPATLAEAGVPEALRTDPFTGKDLGYKVEGEGFRLWSAGPDGKDEGGASPALPRKLKVDSQAKGDLVFAK